MQLPGAAAWVPQTPTQLTPAATPNSAMPQAIAYPTMQQFQVSPQVKLFHLLSYKNFLLWTLVSSGKQVNLINFL